MSLDLSGKSGVNTAGTFGAGLTAGPVNGDFGAGVMSDSNTGIVYLDTTAGPITVTMAELDALTGIEPGDTIILKKATADANNIIFVDGDGVSNVFVNRQTEFYCVQKIADGNWILN